MYHHREAMREFKWKHPYLYTLLSSFTAMTVFALCCVLGCAPLLTAIFACWYGIFAYFVTIPLAITLVHYVSDLFNI